MAGILPYAKHIIKQKPTLFFLLSRERISIESYSKDKGKWSDFGGSRNKNETIIDVAVREGYEESNGILGSMHTLHKAVISSPLKLRTSDNYYTFFIEIPYDTMLPTYFKGFYKQIETNFPELVKKDNGFFEKDKVKWLTIDELLNNTVPIRPYYMSIIHQLANKRNINKLRK